MMASTEGRMCLFTENEIRVMGRTASGVRGINLNDSDCIGMEVSTLEDNIIIATRNGYGKKTKVSEFKIIEEDQDLMIITNSGIIIRLPLNQISQLGRVTQGVRLINLKDKQVVSTISIVEKEENSEEEIEIKED